MFFNLERNSLLLHFHADYNVEVLCFLSSSFIKFATRIELWIICILHVSTGKLCIQLLIDKIIDKIFVKFIERPELTSEITASIS